MATSSLVSKPFLKGSAGTDSGTRRPFSPSSFRVSVRRHQFRRLEVRAGGDIFGKYFKVATYGESHGKGVGCVISGCPPGVPLSETDMQVELDRRRPGQSRITTPRKETDTCEIRSGIHEGLTIGTPIAVFVPNTDQRGHDYEEMFAAYRPSHADATYIFKYGLSAIQGGGRSSARETIGRVAAGALAKKILKMTAGTELGRRPTWHSIGVDTASTSPLSQGQVPKLARLPSPPMITAPAPPLLRPRRLSHRPNSAPCVFIEEPFQ